MDYLKRKLTDRAALRRKDPTNFAQYPAAVGGIWTREGDGSRFTSSPSFMRHRTTCHVDDTEAFRFVGTADSLIRLRHKGWYVDHNWDETTRGVVYRLPHGRFIAGACDPWQSEKDGSGPFLMENESFDTQEEAARAADGLAECYSEACREDDAKQTAAMRIEEAGTEIASLRDSIRELVAGIRESVLDPRVCEKLKASIRRERAEIHDLHENIAKWKANYWDAVPN